jgi:hypothetical protein
MFKACVHRFNPISDTNFPKLEATSEHLTIKLQKALDSTAPLFRELMVDFRQFLQKTLLVNITIFINSNENY